MVLLLNDVSIEPYGMYAAALHYYYYNSNQHKKIFIYNLFLNENED